MLPSLSTMILAAIFVGAGLLHLSRPDLYRPIMPRWLPAHDPLILFSGVAQILGGLGLLLRRTCRAAAWGLILLLIAVFPANIEMLRSYQSRGVPFWKEALLWLRLPLQAALIWWTWQISRLPRPRR